MTKGKQGVQGVAAWPRRSAGPKFVEILESRIAPAQVIAVTTLADNARADEQGTGLPGSLHWAIKQANENPGSEIVFETAGAHAHPIKGTIHLAATLPAIDENVTITGPGITIDGGGKYRDLTVNTYLGLGATYVTLTGLNFIGGKSIKGAGLYVDAAGVTVTISDSTFKGNAATYHKRKDSSARGGGLYIEDFQGSVQLNSIRVTGNSATGEDGAGGNAHGGGMWVYAGSVSISDSVITGNHATGGTGKSSPYGTGGLAIGGGIYSTAPLTISGSTISDNTARGGNGGKDGNDGGLGGGGGVRSESTLTIENSIVSGNSATGGSGSVGPSYYKGLPPKSGGAGGGGYGGGVDVSAYTATITDSVISNNRATGGNGADGGHFTYSTEGGKYNGGFGNTGAYGGHGGLVSGGGIHANGNLTITGTTVSGNIATAGNGGNGGAGQNGIYAGPGGSGGDSGYGKGGGLHCAEYLSIATSTISGNAVRAGRAGAAAPHGTGKGAGSNKIMPSYPGVYHGTRGGGIESGNGTMKLSEVTIAGNTATYGGGVFVYQDSMAAVDNCTIALNTSTKLGAGVRIVPDSSNDPVDIVSTIVAQNFLTKGHVEADISGIFGGSNNVIDVDAMLGKLGLHDHGTMETMLPAADSPAVTGGPGSNPDGLTLDQNGQAFPMAPDPIFAGAVQTTT